MSKWKGNIILIGLLIAMFSALIPFESIFGEILEDIIYFRGILAGLLLISIGSAAIFDGYKQNVIIAIAGGLLGLIIMSTINIVYGSLNPDKNYICPSLYFKTTFAIVGLGFIIITIVRLLWNKLLLFGKSLYQFLGF